MQIDSSKIEFLVGDENVLNGMKESHRDIPFSEETICFLNLLSKRLLEDAEAKQYSDVITFAFWCRKSSIEAMKKQYNDLSLRRGRGMSFHITPSNIPVMFAFSLTVSLLAGNSNVIKISRKEFPQVKIICRNINKLLDFDCSYIKPYICIIRYDNESKITENISSICSSRIIWGGNRTISSIRAIPIPPHAIDIPFFDRYSICIINADEYLMSDKKETIAEGFYNDTYFSDQNACTSPQLVIWLGSNIDEAKMIFWDKLQKIIEKKYVHQPIQSVDKYSSFTRLAALHPGIQFIADNMVLCRVRIPELYKDLMEYKCPGGYFFEYEADSLEEAGAVCQMRCQTIAFMGYDKKTIEAAVLKYKFKGAERIVLIGHTMDFTLTWDGFDLIHELTKKLYY